MNKLERTINVTTVLGNTLGRLSGWLVAIMMVLVFVEVFMRYIFNKPPLIADEFAGYLLVAVSFLGIAYTHLVKGHVRITFLVNRVPPHVTLWLRLITLLISEAFIIVMCYASYEYLAFSVMINERSPSWLNFPLKYPQATVLIGFLVFAVVMLGQIIQTAITIANKVAEEDVT
jgi:TRAP-type C4-dicarboxylate transport system permease small subunit